MSGYRKAVCLLIVMAALLLIGCGYSRDDLDNEYQKGYEAGREEGYREGRNEWEDKSYDSGFDSGYEEGYFCGYNDALADYGIDP